MNESTLPAQDSAAKIELPVPTMRLLRVVDGAVPASSRDFMVGDLARSGLTPEDIEATPLPAQIVDAPRTTGYHIPYFDLGGTLHPRMWRRRLRDSARRYDQPSREAIGDDCVYPYIPPATHRLSGEELIVCEGEKKAAAVAKFLGLPAIGIGGAGNWRAGSKQIAIHPVILALLKLRQVSKVTIVPDGDVRRYDLAKEYGTFATQLQHEGYEVSLLAPPGKIDDLLVQWGGNARGEFGLIPRIASLVEHPKSLADRYGLGHAVSSSGTVKLEQNLANVLRLLRQHPAFPRIWFNEDTDQVFFEDMAINADFQGIDVLEFLQYNLQMPKIDFTTVRRALTRRAYDEQRSPFRERLASLKWDGESRLEKMFPTYCGSPDTEFTREVGRKWLPGAVWRAMEPGCPIDYMLITSGPQGRGKSTFPAMLFGKEHVVTILGKEGQQKDDLSKYHMGKCVSFEEFDTMYVSNIGHLKGVITNRTDTYRKPYDVDTKSHPRACVFYASTNKRQFLKHDDTGYRRFVVVPFPQLDFAALIRDRDQLWAEAVARWQAHKDGGTLFELSEIDNATPEAKQYVHEEDYLARFDEWAENLVENPTSRAGVVVHDKAIYISTTQAYFHAGIEKSGKQSDKSALKEHMMSTGWEFVLDGPRGNFNIFGAEVKRLKKVWRLRL